MATRPSSRSKCNSISAKTGCARLPCQSTEGLKRGMKVNDTGGPITVPVGEGTLGRVFNVTGDPVDNRGPVKFAKRYPIHRPAPSLTDQDVKAQVLETGIKVIDLDLPVYQRWQSRRIRRRRRWQDRRHSRVDQQHRQRAWRIFRLRRCGRTDARRQRSLCRNERSGRDRSKGSQQIQSGAGLRTDERAAGRASASCPLRSRHDGVFPRRKKSGRAFVYR